MDMRFPCHASLAISLWLSCIAAVAHVGISSEWLAHRMVAPVHPKNQPSDKVIQDLSPYCTYPMTIHVGPPKADLAVVVIDPVKQVSQKANEAHAQYHSACHHGLDSNSFVNATIFLFPGYRLSKATLLAYSSALAVHGYRSILVDLPAQGKSTGKHIGYGPLEAGNITQLVRSMRCRGLLKGKVGLLGVSYGAAAALDTGAVAPNIAAIVAVAPFVRVLPTIMRYIEENHPRLASQITPKAFHQAVEHAGKLLGYSLKGNGPIHQVSQIKASVLYIAGGNDQLVPVRAIRRLVRETPHAHLNVKDGAGHFSLATDTIHLAREAGQWFARIFKKVPDSKSVIPNYSHH